MSLFRTEQKNIIFATFLLFKESETAKDAKKRKAREIITKQATSFPEHPRCHAAGALHNCSLDWIGKSSS